MAKTEVLIDMVKTCYSVYHAWCKNQVTVQPKITGLKLIVSFDDGITDLMETGEVKE